MQIRIKDYDGKSTYIEIDVGGRDVTLLSVFNGVGICTEHGLFGIAQRDGGIEVKLDGKSVWSSADQTEGYPVKSGQRIECLYNRGPYKGCKGTIISVEWIDITQHHSAKVHLDDGRIITVNCSEEIHPSTVQANYGWRDLKDE